jgi:hypothetical protein
MIERTEDVFAALRDPATEAALNQRRVGDGTIERIAKEIGVSWVTVRRQLGKLKKRDRAHIVGWTDGCSRAPIWASGPGEDAPKPALRTTEEIRARQRAYREAAKERRAGLDPDQCTPSKELDRINKYIDQVLAAGPRSWCAALEVA